MPTTSVSAIVLAAGTASRMGSPKQLLSLGTKTLLEHTLANLRAAQVSEIVVVLGAAAEKIQPLLSSDFKVVVNSAFAEGMGTSLQCGLKALDTQTDATLVVLADQPLVKPSTIQQLIAGYREHKPQILIPLYRGFRGNPVLLDRSVFPEIAGLNGDMGCRALFGDHLENIRKLEVNDPGVLLDADRPQDLAALQQIYQSGQFDLPLMETSHSDLPTTPDLVVVGREAVASSIVKLAHFLQFRVTVVDPLLNLAEMPEASGVLRTLDFQHLPGTARQLCVVASMGRFDEEAIGEAIRVGIPYIALVGNKKRAQEVLQSLALQGVSADRLSSVRTKPGLAIGAKTPQEIALSIVAEIVAQLRA